MGCVHIIGCNGESNIRPWSSITLHHISSLQTSTCHTHHHHDLASAFTHTHSATVQNMSCSIKHLNVRAVKQIAGIQQGHVGSKSRDRITLRRRGGARVRSVEPCSFSLRIRVSSAWVWGYFSWHRDGDINTGGGGCTDKSRTKDSKWSKVCIEERAGWLRVKSNEGRKTFKLYSPSFSIIY